MHSLVLVAAFPVVSLAVAMRAVVLRHYLGWGLSHEDPGWTACRPTDPRILRASIGYPLLASRAVAMCCSYLGGA